MLTTTKQQTGKLEYHLPSHFSADRPLFLFTVDDTHQDMSISDHPVLRNMPKPDSHKPAIHQPAAASFRPYMRSPTGPQHFDDWLYGDIPQLALHVVCFSDATIITATLLHTLSDMLGLGAFYRAWLMQLQGRADDIAPYVGYLDKDPLEGLQELSPSPPPKYDLAEKEVGRWGYTRYILRHIWDCFWYPEASLRFFTLPGEFVEGLSAQARAELSAAAQNSKDTPASNGDNSQNDTFVSNSDVLCAWWVRLLVKVQNHLPSSSTRTINLTNRFDSRDVLADAGLLPSRNVSFFGNAAYNASFLKTAGSFHAESQGGETLGVLAKQVRESIKLHRGVDQLQAQDAAFRENKTRTGHLPLYGDGDMMWCVFTNIYRGRLYQMDWSAAIKGGGGTGAGNGEDGNGDETVQRGRPAFITCTGVENRLAGRNQTAIMGRNDDGVWWMSCRLRDDVWKKMEDEFAKL